MACTSNAINDSFKHKVLYTVCLYGTLFSVGWGRSQQGPALVDLLQISNVDLETGSWMLAVFYIGYALGSLTQGYLYDKMNRKLIFLLSHLCLSCTFFAIPWCYIFGFMAFVHSIQGFFNGVVDSAANAVLVTLWTKHGKVIYMAVSFLFCTGGILSPLVTSPFLSEKIDDTESMKHLHTEAGRGRNNMTSLEYTTDISIYSTENTSSVNMTVWNATESTGASYLYIPYSISGCIFLCVAFLFLVSYCLDYNVNTSKKQEKNNNEKTKRMEIPFRRKIIILIVMSALICVHDAADAGQIGYLSVFCIKHLHWTKGEAALITSMNYICMILAGLGGVALVMCLETRFFVGMSLILGLLSQIGSTFSSYYYVDAGVWLCVLINAFAKSNVFALVFTWTNEYITEVTGKISSLFFISAMVASAVNPILLGYLMEEISNLWYCYLFLIEHVLLILLFVIALLLTFSLVKKYGTMKERKEQAQELEMTVQNLLPGTNKAQEK